MTLTQDPRTAGRAPDAGSWAVPGGAPPGGTSRPPVLVMTDRLGHDLDALTDAPVWAMSPAELAEAVLEVHRQQARLKELELRLLREADANGVGKDEGATSTAAWFAQQAAAKRATWFSDLHLAQALEGAFEATRQAFAAGVIDAEKARVVVHAVTKLTDEHDDLPEGTHAKAEAHLLDLAARFDVKTLRALGRRLFEVVCPEAADEAEGRAVEEEEKRARRLAYLSMRDNGDGTVEGRFRVPAMHADLLRKVLEGLTSPRRLGEGRLDPETGAKLPASTLLGHGFMDLLENHLNLESLPRRDGSPFTMVVTVGLDVLQTGIGTAVTETGTKISAGEARRLACKAGIIPMVLGGDSMPLDLGRERRLFSKHQKIAMDHTYGGCAAEGCDRSSAWMEYHHTEAWHRGGRTDLKDGLPFCPPHHHMADHPELWDMRRLSGGGIRFSRRQ
jgi:hypothetical protein